MIIITLLLSLWAAIAAYRSYPKVKHRLPEDYKVYPFHTDNNQWFLTTEASEAGDAWFSASHHIPVYRPRGMMDD